MMNLSKRLNMVRAMDLLGYFYDELESSAQSGLRFIVYAEYGGGTVYFSSWEELEEWLQGVVIDDPEVCAAVEKLISEN